MPFSSRLVGVFLALFLVRAVSAADNVAPIAPNSDPTYQQLRTVGLGPEEIDVKDFTLKRDAATFHLRSGTVCFVSAVQGKVTGAVFVGDGNMVLEPPTARERASLKQLTREDEFSENFSQLVLRFTDGTYDEIKKAGSAGSRSCDPQLLRDTQNALHRDQSLRFNLDALMLQDVLSGEAGGIFVAFIHGQKYNDKEVFAIDPHGAPPLLFGVAPEEVELVTYDRSKFGVWASFHLANEYKNGKATGSHNNRLIHIEHQQLDTTVEKNANLIGKATTTLVSQTSGLRVVPFDLFPRLRVQAVTTESGQPLSFIQEGKDEDAEFFSVLLPKPLAEGEKFTIVTNYSGKDAVSNEGDGNYFPIARENWYPNNSAAELGEYTNYDMTFHIPKGMKMAATGTLVSENNADQNVSVWKSEVPQTVAGFNFGKFKKEEVTLDKPPYLVQAFANENPPAWVEQLKRDAGGPELTLDGSNSHTGVGVALGNMNTTVMMKKALADGQLSIELYSDFFGALPYKRVAITQQTACNFGQSWPTLVWLPICSYFDNTVRHQLGLDRGDRGYWKTVGPHEVAHQWWGHEVGFASYRDQWMSEGFADMSASLFLQAVYSKEPNRFLDFWNDEREMLIQRNKDGNRPIDVGPVTQGYRLNNSRAGFDISRDLIYPKGAYILHMVRMMMWDRQTGDQNFKATMQDFVKTYAGKAATTEDFKAMVEKHMTPEMSSFGQGKMDWFFDEYVYGTALPNYNVQSSFQPGADGMVMNLKVTQSNVGDGFRMLVPLYLEMGDGSVRFLGRARLTGNATLDQKIPLKGLTETPKRVVANHYYDVLATTN